MHNELHWINLISFINSGTLLKYLSYQPINQLRTSLYIPEFLLVIVEIPRLLKRTDELLLVVNNV